MAANKILTDEQYNILLEGESYFQEFEKTQYFRSMQNGFQSRLKSVHDDFFGSPLNTNCYSCMGQALSKLWHHMGVKKYLLDQEELRLQNEQKNKQSNKKGN